MDTDPTLQTFLHDKVVLFKVDAEAGDGPAMAKAHEVRGYPTFVLVNGEGETLDRWMGFGGAEPFISTATAAVTDPMPLGQRVRRFRGEPTAKDAGKLGDLMSTMGHYGDAIAYFRRAQSLDPAASTGLEMPIFEAMTDAGALYTLDDVRGQADRTIASASPADKVRVAFSMRHLTDETGSRDAYVPYLEAALAASEGTQDENLLRMRGRLLVDHALYVEHDGKKALDDLLATKPAGWEKSAEELNSVAWWCFENEVELDKAEKWARKGVELAAPGTEKANVLDTLAEICAVKGDCGDSVEYTRMAIQEDPKNEYFQKQLVKFQALLAQKKG